MSELDETIQRLVAKKGVKGVIVLAKEGSAVIRSTVDEDLAAKYAKLIGNLVDTARSTVHTLDDQNDLTFLRVRTKKHEVMISPGR
ncbi:hypothetical protein IWQ60_007002 [Tieghemiomyces parasiticus]|uniref:Dynein light chain roadblock n=1 Tax=Tieghemiomyces parasiticus TaxID=78921 RepID=A0A9W8A3Q5_9FUNG|nr:hypothetical protein IWQ60_007002 [Tieghemiomyces parasiticus]